MEAGNIYNTRFIMTFQTPIWMNNVVTTIVYHFSKLEVKAGGGNMK
jgi:hypothetical protein